MIRQEIIRDVNYNIIEEYDNCGNHIKYNSKGCIRYYKCNNFEFPSFKSTSSFEEQEFIGLLKNVVIKIDENRYPNCILLFKNDSLILQYDSKNKTIWFNYGLIWSVFRTKYSLEYKEIEKFLEDIMGKHFNCWNIIPVTYNTMYSEVFERHFNLGKHVKIKP